MVQYAPLVRHNAGRNALQVRNFPGGSAPSPALKSVKNQCEIFNGFYLKIPPIKVYRGVSKIFGIFLSEKIQENDFEILS